MGRLPHVIEVRWKAFQNLFMQCRFPWHAKNLAIMLIAHARRCKTCFGASRYELERLGFDEATLDGICANTGNLPLDERDRLFVQYALKIALDSANLQPQDLRDMEAHGFSKEEIQEIIGFAAYWIMNIVFSQSMLAGLEE
jgi:alkylhydroperoxidase family enzyme